MATKKSLNLMPHIPPAATKVLIQSRVCRAMFDEIQQRAALENRSLANFLENWLEGTFKDYPISGPFPGTEKKVI